MSDPIREPAPPWPGPRSHGSLGARDLVDDAQIDGRQVPMAEASGAETSFVEITNCDVAGGSFAGSDWYRARWASVGLTEVDLANAALLEAVWERLDLRGCRATGIGLGAATISDVTVHGGTWDMASLRSATLRRVRFTECALTNAEFGGAVLEDVAFVDCDLAASQWAQSRHRRVLMDGCRLDGIGGISSLRGVRLSGVDTFLLAHQLAAELGIALDD